MKLKNNLEAVQKNDQITQIYAHFGHFFVE